MDFSFIHFFVYIKKTIKLSCHQGASYTTSAHAHKSFPLSQGELLGYFRRAPAPLRPPSALSGALRRRSAALALADFLCRRLPRPPLPVVVLGDATEV